MNDVDRESMQRIMDAQFVSYPELFNKMRSLSDEYGGMPMQNLINAFGMAQGQFGFGSMDTPNPFIQNSRVKAISTLPRDFTKNQVANMIANPNGNEMALRQVEHALEYTAYPLFHTRTIYQNLLTYHNYIAPYLADKEETKKDDFWREYKLLEKLRTAFDIKSRAHEITGQAIQEGKVFYYPRYSVDKSHNKVNYAFLQQLPSDWIKIVGLNNKSKYTVSFNLMYFTQYGTDFRQFGDLFAPYFADFNSAVYPAPKISGTKLIYASNTGIDLSKIKNNAVDSYYQNGRWYYWVTLPADAVFPFEIDDTSRNAITPFTGLLIDMIQLADLEAIQLSLLANPLFSIVTGEIPYYDTKDSDVSDKYKLSPSGRKLFEAYFYQMLQANNTNGIGLYSAPFQNIRLQNLAEAPSAMDIVSKGFQDTMAKAGLTGIIPVSDEARAGAVQVSLMIESQFGKSIYDCFERMMNAIIEKLNLNYEWRFHIFGDLSSDKQLGEDCRSAMTLGILPDTMIYNALHDRSILDDITWSDTIISSKLLDRRMPLVSSYSAKQETSGLPPKGGRPESEGTTSDGQEQDEDANGKDDIA